MRTTQIKFEKKTDAILCAREMCYQGGYGAVIYDSESELYYAESRPVRNRPVCQKQVWQQKTKKGDPDSAKEDQSSQIDEGGSVFTDTSYSKGMTLRQRYVGQMYAARLHGELVSAMIGGAAALLAPEADTATQDKIFALVELCTKGGDAGRIAAAYKDADALIAAGRVEEPEQESDDGPKRYHGVGTRIYNRGNMNSVTNPPHFGTITRLSIETAIPDYTITPDAKYKLNPYQVSAKNFSDTYCSDGSTPFVTEAAHSAWMSQVSSMPRGFKPIDKGVADGQA